MNKRNIVGVLAVTLLLSVPLVTAEPVTTESYHGAPAVVDVNPDKATFGEQKYAEQAGKDATALHMPVAMSDNAVVTKDMSGSDYTTKAFMKKHHDGKFMRDGQRMYHDGMRHEGMRHSDRLMNYKGEYMNHDGQRMHHNHDGQTCDRCERPRCDRCARPRCDRCECGCRRAEGRRQEYQAQPRHESMRHESMRNLEDMPRGEMIRHEEMPS